MSLSEGHRDYHTLVAAGDVAGSSLVGVFGAVSALPNNKLADVWWPGSGGVTLHKDWAQAASTIKIASTSAEDAAGGLGVRSVLLEGLDIDRQQISEIVPTDGLTDAISTKGFLRLNPLEAVDVGEYETGVGSGNKGIITARRTSDDAIEGQIGLNPDIATDLPNTRNFGSHLSVAAGFTFFITNIVLHADVNRPMTFIRCSRAIPDTFAAPYPALIRRSIATKITGLVPLDLTRFPLRVEEKTDFWFMAATSIAGTGDAQVEYQGLMVKKQ